MMFRDIVPFIKHRLDTYELEQELKDEQPGHGMDRFKEFGKGEHWRWEADDGEFVVEVRLLRRLWPTKSAKKA